ncbi:hypothetical protein ELI13_32505 [Rhizobium ruizarguesonis]|jgi:hypothetical protein|uniref:Uncharacterized protein n=1 Tax=Rhizobium ruizarguesonis TaxID=2081791 RepID=A0AAE4YVK8_9HYPH|nr:hypothetical protein [Rhizobium ruizarguesonis]NEI51469.1 hypothetical protein [Rhizobium ruizarguesonis]TAT71458.1 hypothetical protein ELI52_35735 [Rhizobium ruizarguesonis]TAT94650.1 hypothetical protein ELI53_30705 [Rhizobium ruizarguesonis]TAU18019.1 hypothetical protein ELI48_29195 [Rhizobium ruizarguesonis]TAU68234.1 hypothetical protein ELI45_10560 [Rhizobium ruizarguesonis]
MSTPDLDQQMPLLAPAGPMPAGALCPILQCALESAFCLQQLAIEIDCHAGTGARSIQLLLKT